MSGDSLPGLIALRDYFRRKGKLTTSNILNNGIESIFELQELVNDLQEKLNVRGSIGEQITAALMADIEAAKKRGEEPPEIAGVQIIYKTKEK